MAAIPNIVPKSVAKMNPYFEVTVCDHSLSSLQVVHFYKAFVERSVDGLRLYMTKKEFRRQRAILPPKFALKFISCNSKDMKSSIIWTSVAIVKVYEKRIKLIMKEQREIVIRFRESAMARRFEERLHLDEEGERWELFHTFTETEQVENNVHFNKVTLATILGSYRLARALPPRVLFPRRDPREVNRHEIEECFGQLMEVHSKDLMEDFDENVTYMAERLRVHRWYVLRHDMDICRQMRALFWF